MSRKAKSSNFDPRKKYEWQVTDEFTVTGAEINVWNRALNVIMASDDFQRFLVVQNAALAMQNFLKEAVEEGLIKEATPEVSEELMQKRVTAVKADESNGQPEQISEEVSNG